MKILVCVCLAVASLGLGLGIAQHWLSKERGERTSATDVPATLRVLSPSGARIEDYLGAKACASCHRSIHDRQSTTHMAHALTTVEEYQRRNGSLPTGNFYDADNEIPYEIVTHEGRLSLKATRGTESVRAPMMFVVGSGLSGLTFLSPRDANEFQELRLSFYTVSREWDYTSGQENSKPSGLEEALGDLSAGRGQKCLACHSTLLVQNGEHVDLDRSQWGVSCERCHGPGRQHVEAAERGEFVPTGNRAFERAMRATDSAVEWREQAATRDMRVCGDCHGRHAMNPNVPDLFLSRFPVAALPLSKCYQRSLGKLLCTDCHDPHANAERVDQSSYVQLCLTCHGPAAESVRESDQKTHSPRPLSPASRRVCPVNRTDGCIGCHMPKREPVYRGTFTHHRIAIHSEASTPDAASGP